MIPHHRLDAENPDKDINPGVSDQSSNKNCAEMETHIFSQNKMQCQFNTNLKL